MTTNPASLITIDCMYEAPERAASYLLIERGQAVFVENNTAHAVPRLLAALQAQGLEPAQVAYLIITHLHLDHSGGTSVLAERCPNATVLCHPRGVRHLADPSRLIAGVRAVYGDAEYERLFAPIGPIAADRIRGMEDGETLEFGGRVFTFLHTRGHANHHLCIFDSKTRGVFTGDAFGVDYKPSRPTKRPFLLCSTAPTDFDADAARASIERIVATGAERVYLTHFGELAAVKEGADVMIESINRMERILRDAIDAKLTGPALQAFCERRIHAAIEEQLAACGTVLEPGAWENLDVHNRINAQGLAYLAEKANG